MKSQKTWVLYCALQVSVLGLMLASSVHPRWFSQDLSSEYRWEGGLHSTNDDRDYAELADTYCAADEGPGALCELFSDLTTVSNIVLTLSLFVISCAVLSLIAVSCHFFSNHCLAYTYLSSCTGTVSAVLSASVCFGLLTVTFTDDCREMEQDGSYGPVCVHSGVDLLLATTLLSVCAFVLHCVIAPRALTEGGRAHVYQDMPKASAAPLPTE